VVSLTCAGLVVGAVSVAHASYDDFDSLLRKTHSAEARLDLLRRAQRAHPTDYYYLLVAASLEPIKAREGGPSPRFHDLNRALSLCPTCEAVHVEIARGLWALKQHQQALLEWRTAVGLQPRLLNSAMGELFTGGATPEELASIATGNPARLIDVAGFLNAISRPAEALVILGQAEALGVPLPEILLMRGKLQLELGQTTNAIQTLVAARAAGAHDIRLTLLDVRVILATKGAQGADQALALLDQAASQNPVDLDVQRARIDLVTSYQKWQATDRALNGFKEALYRSSGSAVEAHIAGARIYSRISRWTNALDEYRIALAEASTDVNLWMEYGQTARSMGRTTAAREAYAEAARLSPQNPEVVRALQEIDRQQASLRAQTLDFKQP
jgi:Tetratricopeptide repeat